MDLEPYLTPLLRKWWFIVFAVLSATGACFLALRSQPPTYQSRATVMVGRSIDNPNPNGNDLYLTEQLASTYADIAKRDQVRNGVMKTLGLNWLPPYNVRVVPNTQLIELTVTDSIPERAQKAANELARQLILQSPAGSEQDQTRQAFINQQLDELEAGIKETRDAISKKQADLAGLYSARQIADTQAQITALQQKLTTLQANYGVLLQSTQSGATNTVRVIEPAALPTTPVGPNKALVLLLAAAIGCAVAVLGVYAMDYLDDTLKSPRDAEKVLGLDTLASIPLFANVPANGAALLAGNPQARESYSVLRTNLQFAALDHPLKMLIITSAEPSDGKSTVAANLSIALAQADQRVILVDSDLRRPTLHRVFRLANNVGVTSALLQKDLDLDSLLQPTEIPGLRLLPSGPLPPNPSALLSSAHMRRLMAALRNEADVVILDCPPAAAIADAAIMGAQSDGALMVLRAGRSRKRIVQQAVENLRRVNVHMIGVALNRVPMTGSDYYYYHYYAVDEPQKSRRNGRHAETKQPKPVNTNVA
jgi:non-specific protein-tyrosine kinase